MIILQIQLTENVNKKTLYTLAKLVYLIIKLIIK